MPESEDLEALHLGQKGFDELVERLYTRLRALAAKVRWRGPKATQPTSLLHDAYLKLAQSKNRGSGAEEETIGVFANVMRQIMIDKARKAGAGKRGGGAQVIALGSEDLKIADPVTGSDGISREDMLTLNAALAELRLQNPRLVQIIDCRYFLGLTAEETASILDISLTTVEREWRSGRKFLNDRIRPGKQ